MAYKQPQNFKRRLYNTFSLDVDTNTPQGALRYKEFEDYLAKALSAYGIDGKIPHSGGRDERTGKYSAKFAYHGPKKTQDAVNAVLAGMPKAMGYEVDPASGNVAGTGAPPPFTINQLGRKQFHEFNGRIFDQRASASVMAQTIRAGGYARKDRNSKYANLLVPGGTGTSGILKNITREIQDSLSGGPLGSEQRKMNELASALIVQRNAKLTAFDVEEEAFLKANPRSPYALERAMKMQRVTNRAEKERLLKAERDPDSAEYKAKVYKDTYRGIKRSEYEKTARNDYIKKNPKSDLAKSRKKSEKKKGGAVRLAGAALSRILGIISSVIQTAANLLGRIYKQLTEMGDEIRERSTDARRFNMLGSSMKSLQNFAVARGLDKDIFAKAFGKIMHDFSNPTKFNTAAVELLAPVMGMSTKKLTGFLTKEANSPDTIAYSILNSFMNATRNGKGGGRDLGDPNKAYAVNYEILQDFSPELAQLFARWSEDIRNIGGFSSKQEAAKDYEKYMNDPRFNSTKDKGFIKPGADAAAKDTLDQWNELLGLLSGIKDALLTKLIGSLSGLIVSLRNFINRVFGGVFPELRAAENENAKIENNKIKERTRLQMELAEPAIMDYLASRFGDKYKDKHGVERFLADINDIRKTTNAGEKLSKLDKMGLTYEEYVEKVLPMIMPYNVYKHKLQEVREATDNNGVTKFVDNGTLAQMNDIANDLISTETYDMRKASEKYRKNKYIYVNEDDQNITMSYNSRYLNNMLNDPRLFPFPGYRDILLKLRNVQLAFEIRTNQSDWARPLYDIMEDVIASSGELTPSDMKRIEELFTYHKTGNPYGERDEIFQSFLNDWKLRDLAKEAAAFNTEKGINQAARNARNQNTIASNRNIVGTLGELAMERGVYSDQLVGAIYEIIPKENTERSVEATIYLVDTDGNKAKIHFDNFDVDRKYTQPVRMNSLGFPVNNEVFDAIRTD